MKTITAIFRTILPATVGCLLTLSSRAEVRITRFDPPLSVSAFSDPLPGLNWNTTAVDFDLDGQTDFRLTYGGGAMTAYFNSPTRIAMRAPELLNTNTGPIMPAIVFALLGPVASVPLGSMIGSNIVSSVGTNFYAWEPGVTNSDNLPELLGDYQASIIFVNMALSLSVGPINTFSNGILVTNIYQPGPFIFGDVTGKEGVMALEFYLGSERHYGYIHFNFNQGAGGVIYGWAYETEPNVPIKAMPLLPGEKLNKRKILFDLK